MFEWNPKEDPVLQQAINNYLIEHDLYLNPQAEYEPVIDGVYVCVSGYTVLRIGLPPVSNYSIRETEYTDEYMRLPKAVAV